jgi:glycosyltransferase involved in cell wall biosynthesis
MRIMFLVHSLELAGAERQVVNLAKGLLHKGHCVSVITFYARGPLGSDLRDAGVTVHSLQKRKRSDVSFLWRLAKLVRREEPDVLHGYLESPNILSGLLKLLIPNLRVVWGVRCSAKEPDGYDAASRVFSALEPKVSALADLIIINSRSGARDADNAGFPADKIRIIPNGIDSDYFRPDPDAGQRLRRELGVRPTERLIGRIGRFHRMKDYPAFLDTAAGLRRRDPRLRFLCLGNGSLAEEVELAALISQLGLQDCTQVCKPLRDMRSVYNALDLVVSSSAFGEGFPNVVGEAMACGTPCVVTDVGDSAFLIDIPELVVPPRRPRALESACARWFAHPSLWDRDRARQRIVNGFSVRQLVDRTEQLLSSSFFGS